MNVLTSPWRLMAGSAVGASETDTTGELMKAGTILFNIDTINLLSLPVEIENLCLNAVSVVATSYSCLVVTVADDTWSTNVTTKARRNAISRDKVSYLQASRDGWPAAGGLLLRL